jgi:hypothetical protein
MNQLTEDRKAEQTIGYIGTTGKYVARAMSLKFTIDVCSVKHPQTNEYRLFAHCTVQRANQLKLYLEGFKEALKFIELGE